MKIVLNTPDSNLLNYLIRYSKTPNLVPAEFEDRNIDLLFSRVEAGIFDNISDSTVDAYMINVPVSYSQKAVDFIKKKHPYIPVVLFGPAEALVHVSGADIYMPLDMGTGEYDEGNFPYAPFFNTAVWNIANYLRNFAKLRKLTTKMSSIIEFGQCKYDPTRRTLLYKDKEIKKLSAKEGGILEVLSSNFGEVVKKEIILEKVWHKSDYFSGRSMDVYVTHLRRLLRDSDIDMNIKNISGVGLILE